MYSFQHAEGDSVKYRGADKFLARIDNSYMKIKHVSCLSSL